MSGFRTMLVIQWRTQWRAAAVSVIALTAAMVGTAAAVAALYDTPAKIHSYAQAVVTGDALAAINGRVEGIDSLGGVIQDEFGFLAAFVLPLLGISLVARTTRREEESGRLEVVLGGRVARQAPAAAALVFASAAITITSAGFAAGLVSQGVPVSGAVLYAASLGALAFVFAGLAGLLAQITLHTRSVYTFALIILGVAYALRGAGDVNRSWVTWLSPLGWAERAAPFAAQRWWTLCIPLVLGMGLAAAGIGVASRRDLGSALLRTGRGAEHAPFWLRAPAGLAVWIHRPAWLGWLAGSVALSAMLGALSRQLLDAMQGNPAVAQAIGATGRDARAGLVSMAQLYLAVLATGYAVQAVATLREEETAGRLELRLTATLSRGWWLAAHGLVIGIGLIGIVFIGSTALALTTAWSFSDTKQTGAIIGAGAAYLPAELVVAAFAIALFGVRPQVYPMAWTIYAVSTFIALLGTGLRLPGPARDASPFTHIGSPPLGPTAWTALAVLAVVTATLVALAFIGFRSRAIPHV